MTANDTELDEVTGLTLGADDYVTKPFSLMALRLRVNNLLSRALAGKPCDVQNRYEKHGLLFDFDNLIFKKNQQYVDENALSVSVKRLRDKIECSGEKIIHTVYGIGYVFKWEE